MPGTRGRECSARHGALLLAILLVLSLPFVSSLATAAPIDYRLDSISVDYSSSWGPGLGIEVSSLPVNSFFTLDEGESASLFPLQIGTGEEVVNGRDTRPRFISAAFQVTVLGTDAELTGTVTGTTVGVRSSDRGVVTWDGPVTLEGADGYELQVAMSDGSFATPGDVAIRTTFSRPLGSGGGGGVGDGGSNMPEPTSAVLFLVGGVAVRSAVKRRRR